MGLSRTRLVSVAAAIAILSACGGSGSPPNASPDPNSSAARGTGNPTAAERLSSTDSSGSQPSDEHGRIGGSCSTRGTIGFMSGGPVICDGVWRYAMANDLPAAPSGGYQKKPDWYPTLAQIYNRPQGSCSSSDVHFTASVLPPTALIASVPYGAMVADHVTPIDHGYLGVATLSRSSATLTEADYVPIVSPADGTIIEASSLGSPTSHRVVIDHGCNVYSVYMVINRLTGVLAPFADEVEKTGNVRPLVTVHAGEQFGMQRDNPLDFNVVAQTEWLKGYVNPLSYAYGAASAPYTTDPLPFFSSALRPVYEQIMQRTELPRWGIIDHDVAGAAAGNWFIAGTIGYSGESIERVRTATSEIPGGHVDGKNNYPWGHLAFAPHWVRSDSWIASFGVWADPKGDFRQFLIDLQPGQPTPDQLTSASGIVVYRLTDWQSVNSSGTPLVHHDKEPEPIDFHLTAGRVQGLVAVRVNADGTMSVETLPGLTNPAAFAGFTAAANVYHR